MSLEPEPTIPNELATLAEKLAPLDLVHPPKEFLDTAWFAFQCLVEEGEEKTEPNIFQTQGERVALPDFPIVDSLLDEDGEGASTFAVDEDSKAAALHSDAYALYKKANAEYRTHKERKADYIQINQGVRSTREQARLYEAYYRFLNFGGPNASPANQPGKSFHEYGFAIDIIRNDDDDLLNTCLLPTGWEKINADEGWHFEARGADAFADVRFAIDKEAVPTSYQFVQELDGHLRKKKNYDDEMPAQLDEERRLQSEAQTIRSTEQALSVRTQDLTRRRAELQRQNNELNQLSAQINNDTARYNGMSFNSCPNGNSFNQCEHEDLKRNYLASRSALYNSIMDKRNRFTSGKQRYDVETAQYNQDLSALSTERAEFNRRKQKFNREQAASRKERTRLNGLLTRSQQHRAQMNVVLSKLIGIVNKIRSGA